MITRTMRLLDNEYQQFRCCPHFAGISCLMPYVSVRFWNQLLSNKFIEDFVGQIESNELLLKIFIHLRQHLTI